jgi:4-amino-4-deoxy-L-arabinose transferase-like glycosyltransferase
MMNMRSLILLSLVFLVAFSLRFYDCTNPSYKYMDETGHVPAATNYWYNGQFEPDHWEHPPLRPIMLYGFLQVFGDNPYGWRMRNILFGSAAAALTFLLALGTSGSKKNALLAGLLLATDPLHIALSRHTFCEIYSVAFFLAAVVLYQWHKQRSSWLMLSAFFVGCAMATKWYYFPAWFLLFLLALYEHKNYRKPGSIIFISCSYLLIPLSVYTLAFYSWFGRGYSFTEFIEFVTNVFTSMQQYMADNYMAGLVFITHLSAGEWFTSSIVVGEGRYFGNGTGEFILFTNNLPVWILTFPSVIVLLVIAARKKSLQVALPALLFCSSYMQYLFVNRPAFLYSVVPLLPYAFTAIAYTISQFAERYGVRIYYGALAFILAWNMYLYPLATRKIVSVAPYRFILNNNNIQIR